MLLIFKTLLLVTRYFHAFEHLLLTLIEFYVNGLKQNIAVGFLYKNLKYEIVWVYYIIYIAYSVYFHRNTIFINVQIREKITSFLFDWILEWHQHPQVHSQVQWKNIHYLERMSNLLPSVLCTLVPLINPKLDSELSEIKRWTVCSILSHYHLQWIIFCTLPYEVLKIK